MRIESINLSKKTCEQIDQGFGEIKLNKLGHICGIFGKNGVGKTRFLKIIQKIFDSKYLLSNCIINDEIKLGNIKKETKNAILSLKENKNYAIAYANYHLEELKSDTKSNAYKTCKKVYEEIPNYFLSGIGLNINKIHEHLSKQVIFLKHEVLINFKEKIDSVVKYRIEEYEALLEDISRNTPKGNEIESFQNTALKFLQDIAKSIQSADCKNPALDLRFNRFKKIFYDIFGKNLELREIISGTDTTNFNFLLVEKRSFNYSEFSDGQKILFAFIILLFYIEEKSDDPLSKCIILFDEPERNLHPDAIITLIEKLRISFYSGQLFFASHSMDLLAILDVNELFYISNETISRKNIINIIENISGDLLSKSIDLYSSILDWSYNNFMSQCLLSPESIEFTNKEDIQVKSFVEILKDGKGLNVLEFGAGKGRIYKSSEDFFTRSNSNYSAYEINPDDLKILNSLSIRSFTRLSDIPVDSFDFILLCNTLHEIHPNEWIDVINSLINALKKDGYLIFIEKNLLSKGENAHKHGFFVFNNEEIKDLFSLANVPQNIFAAGLSEYEKSKILCVPLEKNSIKHINSNAIRKSINSLKERSFASIDRIKSSLRGSVINKEALKLGHELAFHSVQYINSIQYLNQTSDYTQDSQTNIHS